MTNTVIIHGHSDDLIEIDGAIGEELYAEYGEPTQIRFDDGRLFTVTYDGEWQIKCENPNENLEPVDYSKVGKLPTDALPKVFNDYSEKVVYQSWPGVTTVEKVEDNV